MLVATAQVNIRRENDRFLQIREPDVSIELNKPAAYEQADEYAEYEEGISGKEGIYGALDNWGVDRVLARF